MDKPSRTTGGIPYANNVSFGDVMEKIEKALRQDNKDEFLNLVKELKDEKTIDLFVFFIFLYDSVNCATAILAGETNGRISLTSGLTGVGWTALHESAAFASPMITALLLEAGFSADARSGCKSLNLEEQLPLNVALSQIRSDHWVKLWDQKKSAVRLIMELCVMKRRLENVRLLALKTKEFKHEFLNYVKEGKMVELGTLLMVAGEKLTPLSISEGEDLHVLYSLREIRHYLLAKKDTWLSMNDNDLKEKKGTLLLLDIFHKIGNKLSAFARLKQDDTAVAEMLKVASLIEAAGFEVKTEDLYFTDILYRVYSSAFEWRILQNRPPGESDKSFCSNLQVPSWMSKKQPLIPFCAKSLRPCLPTRHLYHTSSFQKIDSSFSSFTPAKRLVNLVRKFNSCKQCASLVATVQWGLRHV